jgi:hypothetical protein
MHVYFHPVILKLGDDIHHASISQIGAVLLEDETNTRIPAPLTGMRFFNIVLTANSTFPCIG